MLSGLWSTPAAPTPVTQPVREPEPLPIKEEVKKAVEEEVVKEDATEDVGQAAGQAVVEEEKEEEKENEPLPETKEEPQTPAVTEEPLPQHSSLRFVPHDEHEQLAQRHDELRKDHADLVAAHASLGEQVAAQEAKQEMHMHELSSVKELVNAIRNGAVAHITGEQARIVQEFVKLKEDNAAHKEDVEAKLEAYAPDIVSRSSAQAAMAAREAMELTKTSLQEYKEIKEATLSDDLANICLAAAENVKGGMLAGLREGREQAIQASIGVAKESMQHVISNQRDDLEKAVSSGIHTASVAASQAHSERMLTMVEKQVRDSLQKMASDCHASLKMDASLTSRAAVEAINESVVEMRQAMASLSTHAASVAAAASEMERKTAASERDDGEQGEQVKEVGGKPKEVCTGKNEGGTRAVKSIFDTSSSGSSSDEADAPVPIKSTSIFDDPSVQRAMRRKATDR